MNSRPVCWGSFADGVLDRRSVLPDRVAGCALEGTGIRAGVSAVRDYRSLSYTAFGGELRSLSREFERLQVLQPRFGSLQFESNRRELLRVWLQETAACFSRQSDARKLATKLCGTVAAPEVSAPRDGRDRATPRAWNAGPTARPIISCTFPKSSGRFPALSSSTSFVTAVTWPFPMSNRDGHIRFPGTGRSISRWRGCSREWIVRRGRQHGRALGADYYELRQT